MCFRESARDENMVMPQEAEERLSLSERERGDLKMLSLSLANLPAGTGVGDKNDASMQGDEVYVVVIHAYIAAEPDELSVTHGQRLRLLQVCVCARTFCTQSLVCLPLLPPPPTCV